MKLPLSEFIELLCEKLDKITSHSLIAKSSYLKHLKETISPEEAIVLENFAENYTFVVQDEIQSYYWSKKQCYLHPIVIYYMKEKFFERDDLNYDAGFINEIMHQTIDYTVIFINLDALIFFYIYVRKYLK